MITIEYATNFLKEKFGDDFKTAEYIDSNICINEIVAFPILVSSFYKRDSPYQIKNETGELIGEVVFLKNGQKIEIQSLPLEKCICLLQDYEGTTFLESTHIFSSDYVLIQKPALSNYITKYKDTSSIWGGYFHKEHLLNTYYAGQKSISEVVAISNITVDRPIYLETLEIAFKETNPFIRFLKLYHLLELKFDIHTAEKLKEYLESGNKEREIARTLKDYNRDDIDRLESLFLLHLIPLKILPFIDEIKNYKSIADSLFYEYGKTSNPLKEKSKFDALVGLGSFNETNVNRQLGNSTFNRIIPKLAAYWIYRIRSSIAHNKLGEYLMTSNDERFIVEFAEPLLNEIIIQCYKR